MKRTLTVILCMLFCTPSLLLAQHMTVTGKVTDQDGLPLVGVTVVVKGTTNGVSSGSDGAYRISGLSSKDVLQFSSIGMVSAEFTVGNRTVIDVTLKEDMLAIGSLDDHTRSMTLAEAGDHDILAVLQIGAVQGRLQLLTGQFHRNGCAGRFFLYAFDIHF